MHGSQTNTTSPGQSEPGSNGNEKDLLSKSVILKIQKIILFIFPTNPILKDEVIFNYQNK